MPDRIIRESALGSATLGLLSDFAERLFWRLTTVADDYGRFNAHPSFLFGRCMAMVDGATVKKVEDAINQLAQAGTIALYEAEGKKLGHFPNWEKYQRGFRGKPKYPDPPAVCGDLRQLAATRGDLPPYSYSYSKSYSINEIENPSDSSVVPEAPTVSEPQPEKLKPEDLVEGWNDILAPLGLPRVAELSDSRRKKALLRLHEHPKQEWWESVYSRIKGSTFLKGLGPPRKPGEKPFRASFDWLIDNDNNSVKVYEGRYDG